MNDYDMEKKVRRWEKFIDTKGFYWSFAKGGTRKKIFADYKMLAKLKNFMFFVGPAKSKVGGKWWGQSKTYLVHIFVCFMWFRLENFMSFYELIQTVYNYTIICVHFDISEIGLICYILYGYIEWNDVSFLLALIG